MEIFHMHKRFISRMIALSVVPLLLAGCDNFFNYGGGCVSQMRRPSDEEYIAMAVRTQVNAKRMEIDGSEASIRDFHKNNPTCCSVDRDPESRTFLERLIGLYYVEVEVNFKVRADRRKRLGEYYEVHVDLSPCGVELDSYGTGTKTLKEILSK